MEAHELTIGIAEFCRRLGIGRTKTYDLLRRGEIEAIKVGRRTLITTTSVQDFIERSKTEKEGT